MNSLSPEFLARIPVDMNLVMRMGHLEYARGREGLFRTQKPELLTHLQTVASVESTESSNRLEGAVAPRERVEHMVLRGARPANRSESEIAGYRDALRMIHESAEHILFRESAIRQIHQALYRYLPAPGGEYKATQNDIVERDSNGAIARVRFSPVSPVATPAAMRALVERYDSASGSGEVPPLILVALVILDFLCIHPFSDGNGRTARLLTLLLLYHHGYGVGRYVSLERVIEDSRDSYYESLETSSAGWHAGKHDAAPWLDYLLGVLTAAYDEFEQRVAAAEGAGGTKSGMIRAAVSRRVSPFQISDIERELPNVSREMIRVVLKELRKESVIRLEGRGRAAHYVPLHP